eukprot:1152661-Pelagomonas_calceolata.AAC.3
MKCESLLNGASPARAEKEKGVQGRGCLFVRDNIQKLDRVCMCDFVNELCLNALIPGLGWVAVGVKGVARFVVHVHPDVAVTSRPALLPDYARQFQRPGFSNLLPKGSKQQQQLQQQQKKKRGSKA